MDPQVHWANVIGMALSPIQWSDGGRWIAGCLLYGFLGLCRHSTGIQEPSHWLVKWCYQAGLVVVTLNLLVCLSARLLIHLSAARQLNATLWQWQCSATPTPVAARLSDCHSAWVLSTLCTFRQTITFIDLHYGVLQWYFSHTSGEKVVGCSGFGFRYWVFGILFQLGPPLGWLLLTYW